jgi:hypothetical protein
VIPKVAAILSTVDPQLTAGITTMDDIVGRAGTWRFNMLLFGVFGSISLGLTAIGIVGLVVSTVNWRRREIGVAGLGAQTQQVVSLIALQGAKLITLELEWVCWCRCSPLDCSRACYLASRLPIPEH